eukprot:jgi/Ulvmu1/9347/UM050_0099.1
MIWSSGICDTHVDVAPARRAMFRKSACSRRRVSVASGGDVSSLGKETEKLLRGRKFVSLNRAEQDIKDFCLTVEGDEKARCLTTLSRLERQHKRALDKVQDESTRSQAEQELDRLDSMARELSAIGSVQLMVDAIHHLQGKQEADRLRGARQEHPPAKTPEERAAQERLRAVFDRMDSDGDGSLNIAEFRAAMDSLDDHLDGAMVAEICDVLGLHGRVCFDQFEDIVAAEAIRARTRQAAQLRRLLHDDSDDHFREWLDSWE